MRDPLQAGRVVSRLLLVGFVAAHATSTQAGAQAELLERGIYTEETHGDLAAAIDIYKKISTAADAGRRTAAEALVRLGMCYLKSGRKRDAASTLDKLVAEYPEQKALQERLREVLADDALPLLPAPWSPDETLVLCVPWGHRPGLSGAIDMAGVSIFRAREGKNEGKRVTRLEQDWLIASTSMDVDADTLRPLHREYEVQVSSGYVPGKTKARYLGDRVVFAHHSSGSTNRMDLALSTSRPVYDFDQVIPLIRRLPLAEGYRITIPVLGRTRPIVRDARIEVLGRERVSVLAGTFETFKVRFVFADGYTGDDSSMGPVHGQTLWYSTEPHRRLVKVQNTRTWELAAVTTAATRDDPVHFRDVESRVQLTAPPRWAVMKTSRTSDPLCVQIVGPGARVFGSLQRLPLAKSGRVPTPEHVALTPHSTGWLGYTNYVVWDEAVERLDLNGVPAARLAAHYVNAVTRQPKMEYRMAAIHAGHVVTLAFSEIDGGHWDALAPTLHEIARSLRLD